MYRMVGNSLNTCASELLHSNAPIANALTTEFKPATYNGAFLCVHLFGLCIWNVHSFATLVDWIVRRRRRMDFEHQQHNSRLLSRRNTGNWKYKLLYYTSKLFEYIQLQLACEIVGVLLELSELSKHAGGKLKADRLGQSAGAKAGTERKATPTRAIQPGYWPQYCIMEESQSGNYVYRIAAKYSNTLTFKHVLAPLDISNNAGRKHSNIK